MKKLMSMVLAFALVMGICLFGSPAVQAEDTVIEYPVTDGSIYFDTQTGMITECDDEVTAVNIPATIDGVKVTGIDTYAFHGCDNLKDVTLPDGLTTIGDHAFFMCGSLTDIKIPNSVTMIDSYAFYACKSLKNIAIPGSVTTIRDHAFVICDSLEGITIADGVKEIGLNAFSGCSSLTSVTIPGSVTTIGWNLFHDCSSLTRATIMDGVTSISSGMFDNCVRLTSITIPDSVTTIGESAFRGCSSLTDVALPESVTQIQHSAFAHTGLTDVVIPESVTTLGVCAFYSCEELKNVTIMVGVTEIGVSAFEDCSSLTDIYYTGTESQWEEINKEGNDFTEISIRFEPCRRFSDMPHDSNWAYDGIAYCVKNELMNGTSTTTFSPNGTVSRAQLVTILYRVAGSPETEFKGTFTDVPSGQWYSNAIEWAAANGVVNGIGDGKFGPDLSITREQIATILYRYEKEPAVSGNLNSFPDHGKVNNFAANGLIWATQEGLINGISSDGITTLAPQNNATRAQIASIIMRYLEAD